MPILYPIRAVAKLTGISLDTLRAWERRYQAVTPSRGARGRLYSDAHIRRLLLLKEAVENGYAIGQVAFMSDSLLKESLKSSGQLAAGQARKTLLAGSASQILEPVLNAVESFDYTEANQQIGRLAVLLPTRDFVHQVALPLMQAVGEGWHDGNLCVAQEHMATAVLRNVLGSLAYMKSTSDHSSRILFATPADELHEFGILAAAILAAGSGLGIIYLGPNLPSEEIVVAAKRCAPKAVVLGVAQENPTTQVLREVRSVARKLPTAVELWVCGRNPHGVSGDAANGRVVAIEDFETLEKHFYRLGGQF